jgi:hypothetical protein
MLKMCNDVLLVGPSTYLNRLMNHNDAASQWCFFSSSFFPLKYYWPLDSVREPHLTFLTLKSYKRYQKKKRKKKEDSVQFKKKKPHYSVLLFANLILNCYKI